MFGIEEDFKQLMEQVYGPLGKKEQEECDRIAKQLVDNAVKEVKMTEIEKVKAQIKVLEKKLSFLEELEKTKSPAEEGYKKVYGYYPVTDVGDVYWEYFKTGYEQSQKDYKVGEYQEPVPEEEQKTLYQILRDLDKPMFIDDVCSAVKKWMFQYNCDYANCREYLEGYEECQTVLEERIK